MGIPSEKIAMAIMDQDEDDHQASSEVLTLEQAARLLAISTRTLERYVENSLVPHIELKIKGGSRGIIRFLRSELLKWMRQQQVKPVRWRGQGRVE